MPVTLTPQQLQTVRSWMQQKFPQGRLCDACHQNDWDASGVVGMLEVDSTGTFRLGGAAVPVIPLLCRNCGTIWFVSPILMGLSY